MANSPDVRRFVDLTLFDEDPVNVLNTMLETARGITPEWVPQVGQIEVLLSEIFALRSTELGAMANRVPSATVETLLQLFGLFRSDGTKATGSVTITFTDRNPSRTIPAGTQFLYVNSVTNVSYIFVLDETFSVSSLDAGTNSGTANVTASTVGSINNISADSEYLTMLSNVSFVESVVFAQSPSGGRDAETDEDYFNRAVTLLASYTSATTTADQIQYYTLSNKSYANRVGVFDRRRYRNRDITSSSYGYHDGSALVVVGRLVSNSASATVELPVSASNLNDLFKSLDARTPSGLTIDVMSAELASISVTATVYKNSDALGSIVKEDIISALQSYFDPNTWLFTDSVVRLNEVISIIDSVSGVDYVDSLALNGKSLIGSNNVGYYGFGGGSQASFTMDVDIGASATINFPYGEASVYFVDSSDPNSSPTVYMFNNLEFTTGSNGIANDVQFVAEKNGLNYNDASVSGGKVGDPNGILDDASTFNPVSGDWVGATSVSFSGASQISGGSNDGKIFISLNSDSDPDVAENLILKNLGSLVTYGDLDITVL